MRSPVQCLSVHPRRALAAGWASLLVACGLFAPGCGEVDGGGGGDGGGDGDGGAGDGSPDAGDAAGDAEPPDGLLGNWVVTGGSLLPLAGPTVRSVAMRLDADGTGLVVFGDEKDNFVTCTPVFRRQPPSPASWSSTAPPSTTCPTTFPIRTRFVRSAPRPESSPHPWSPSIRSASTAGRTAPSGPAAGAAATRR